MTAQPREHKMVRCESCFGRGYKGGGRLPTCKTCRGTGQVDLAQYKRIPVAYRRT